MKDVIFTFKRHLLLTLLVCIGGILYAQEKVIHVEVSGDVNTLLSATEKASVTKLIVTTASGVKLNEADFTVMNSMPKLKELDLSGDLNTTDFPGNAFKDNATIEKIAFPAHTAIFGGGAFNNSALKGIVSFPKSVTNANVFVSRFDNSQGITGFAFPNNDATHVIQAKDGVIIAYGTNLMKYPCGKTDESYSIPEGVTYIAQQAFGDNNKLKKLIFSSTVSSFQNEAAIIRNSTALEEFDVHPNNPILGAISGLLYKKQTKTLFYYPPGKKSEELVVDGSKIEIVPSGFFTNASTLKRVIFTEGFREVGYTAFKPSAAGTALEYVELPSTTDSIAKEGFHGCKNLLQLICKAKTPPRIDQVVFRESNGKDVRVGVPAESIEAYRASKWNNAVYAAGQGFAADQFVAYHNINVDGGKSTQSVSVSGFQVQITADEAEGEEAFTGWVSEPAGVTFINSGAKSTYFTMPENDVTIKAVFAVAKPYTIVGATVSKSGVAGVGSSVNLETAGTKVVAGNTLYFVRWQVNKGDAKIANSSLATTSFTMTDGEVEIEAIYQVAYMINISGGSAKLEAFEGEQVAITASKRPNMIFSGWTSTTAGVEFADPSAEATTFIMPASEVDIKANFTNASSLDESKEQSAQFNFNPTTETITIENLTDSNYTIYNSLGNTVMRGVITDQTIQINNLIKGLYILTVDGKSFKFFK